MDKRASLVDHILEDLVKGARRNPRTGNVDVHRSGEETKLAAVRTGANAALTKFALSPMTEHALELGGLGLLAAPSIHGVIAGEENKSPEMAKALHLSDLAGLGTLSALTAYKMMKH